MQSGIGSAPCSLGQREGRAARGADVLVLQPALKCAYRSVAAIHRGVSRVRHYTAQAHRRFSLGLAARPSTHLGTLLRSIPRKASLESEASDSLFKKRADLRYIGRSCSCIGR